MKDIIIRAEAGDKYILFRLMPLVKEIDEFQELAKCGEIELRLVDAVRDCDKKSPFLPEDFSRASWKEMLIVCALKSKYDE